MNYKLTFLPYAIMCHMVAMAQSPASEFAEGKVIKFSTKAHAKAKGASFTIKYPASWAAKEGERPNVVQNFVSESGKGLEIITIITKLLPNEVPIAESDIKEYLSESVLKGIIPKNGKFIRATPTEIEGTPATILEFSARSNRAGIELELQTTSLIFFQGRTMIQIQCMVATSSANASRLPAEVAKFRPLFQLVMNSIVFEDKWK